MMNLTECAKKDSILSALLSYTAPPLYAAESIEDFLLNRGTTKRMSLGQRIGCALRSGHVPAADYCNVYLNDVQHNVEDNQVVIYDLSAGLDMKLRSSQTGYLASCKEQSIEERDDVQFIILSYHHDSDLIEPLLVRKRAQKKWWTSLSAEDLRAVAPFYATRERTIGIESSVPSFSNEHALYG